MSSKVSTPPRGRGRPPKGKIAMTDAERARTSRARRSDAAERIEVTFWPILEVSGALAHMSIHIGNHPEAADPEIKAALERAREAFEMITIALWDGCSYGRWKRSYIARYGYVNFLSQFVIDQMQADHIKRLEVIAARTNARFIAKEARLAGARG
jgi:hypothetical protein